MNSDPRSPWVKLRRNPAVVASIFILAVVALAAVIGPWLLPVRDADVSSATFLPPSWAHPFGTDINGRDLFYRVLLGARISLLVGIAGALVSFVFGIVYGMVAGYVGGPTDNALMRFVDVLYAIPRLIFLLVAIGALDPLLRQFMESAGWQT